MKISPIPSTIVPSVSAQGVQQPSQVETYRALKMKTNATPLMNQQQVPIVENNPVEAPVADTQPLSPQLALLARQKRALQVKEREIANREKALSQNSGSSGIEAARLKSDPLGVLLENGVTYEQLTEAIISGQGNSEINALKAEIDSLRKGIDQKFTDNATQAEKQVLAEMRREADQLVRDDQYEFVRETRSVPTVMQLIERTYRESGEVLDVSEALRLVEEELFKDAQRIANLKKMQSQMGPVTPQMQPQKRQTGMRTLTNRDTASVPLSAKARAMAAFYGTLK
jgi:hypothetical protein